MFDRWPDEFSPSLRRVLDPPMPVVVDLGQAIPTHRAKFGTGGVPLRVSSGGLRLTGTVPGVLYAWARAWDGVWLGLCEFTVHTGNDRGQLDMRQWCPEHSLTPSPAKANNDYRDRSDSRRGR
ncbi:hypothetical protein [Nocardia sp. NPDC049149]|uniref:hypothetical protein n=1 Tax=Nocardia sp. NPDC049149 TaxID=3364315 RepID=UPI0037247DA9